MLSTTRLLLRPFILQDASEIFRLNANPEVMRYLPKDEVYRRPEEAEAFLAQYISTMKYEPYTRWAVVSKGNGTWLGWCGLRRHADGKTDLGFRFHQQYWGKGYATEAGQVWLKEGFITFGLSRIIAQTTDENVGSQRVLEKLGFTRTPEKDYEEEWGRWWRYAITADGFRTV